ncbi:MAG: hypothetical protein JWM16_2333 [Verrucomicrobiales bacterium]|nr:hypothetical protein [Verrucomicrobiales bacterium]
MKAHDSEVKGRVPDKQAKNQNEGPSVFPRAITRHQVRLVTTVAKGFKLGVVTTLKALSLGDLIHGPFGRLMFST